MRTVWRKPPGRGPFCQAAFDDGLTKRRVTVDEFFAEFLRG